MKLDPEFASFARLIDSLSPWLDQVVIIGGWAHRLYRFHPLAQRLDYPSLSTLDTDVAVPARIAVKEHDIYERLVANGFREEFLGNNRPPATHYHLGSEKSGFYAEFLTPLTGSAHTRTGRSNATVRIGGVSSQKLRHLEILLNAPWHVELSDTNGFPSAPAVRVQIASPISFLAQKILIHQKRSQSERAKDILYLHDTLQLFGARLPELRSDWLSCVKLQLHTKSVAVIERAPEVLFGRVSDSIRSAALMAAGRILSPEAIREACQFGLTRILQ
jgi:hypothetical protein